MGSCWRQVDGVIVIIDAGGGTVRLSIIVGSAENLTRETDVRHAG